MTMDQPFDSAVQTHGATVLRVCRAVLGAGADADDAWSETFLAALRAWPDLERTTQVEAWLVRVAQRKAIDVIRARQRGATPVAAADDAPAAAYHEPEQRVVGAEVWQEVARLPERQRLAVAYHYLGGLPHAETAALTGSTPAAVRRAAADGVAALRRRLGGVLGETTETGAAR